MTARSPDPFPPEKPFKDNTYYQILYVEPSQEKNEKITTNILAKTRKKVPEQAQTKGDHPYSFDEFELDDKTVEHLKDYPRQEKEPANKLSSYLPSPGVIFPKGFINSLSKGQTELGNFYIPLRILLHSRKISQLIAKTWWAYLEARKTDLLDKFTAGEWDNIDSDILDGLVAREIFLYAGADSPDNPDPEDPSIYSPLKPQSAFLPPTLKSQSTDLSPMAEETTERTRFLILPNSRAWQGISLSLLLAGQAYYKIGDKYHQIAQPILSTGEITIQYSLEVDWGRFHADIKEIIFSQDKPWIAYHVIMPYPPIPFDVVSEDVKKWAYAKEEYSEEYPEDKRNFPFYKKDGEGKYLIDVDYFRSPYPYIPLSSS